MSRRTTPSGVVIVVPTAADWEDYSARLTRQTTVGTAFRGTAITVESFGHTPRVAQHHRREVLYAALRYRR